MRKFKGSVALIFQPAEEIELPSGGLRMVQEGIMDRFSISQVFGMHNKPGLEIGTFGVCDGPTMGSQDDFDIIVKGRGGHAASPHRTVDPVVIASTDHRRLAKFGLAQDRSYGGTRDLCYEVEGRTGLEHHPRSRRNCRNRQILASDLRDFAEREGLAFRAGHSARIRRGCRVQVPSIRSGHL
ncbi:M20/M25/M40 family metallo-hydrolase [Mesorhizobium sp. M0586]|uniref:M20/M25/M40 family metallo-hydrolase n=1 Tax=unclassified Mesorhizobium TaxID=325217 RepID=UPI003336900D